MTFAHELVSGIDLKRIDTDNGRYYVTEGGGIFPSVTSVIDQQMDKSYLKAWQDRIGIEEANKIKTQAANRGTAVHNLFEKFLLNDPLLYKGAMPVSIFEFKQLAPVLKENVEMVYGVEWRAFSEALNTAGAIDAIVKWKGIKSILDLKTSRRVKKREDILSYWIQTEAYRRMWNEMNNDNIEQVVILMYVDHQPEPLVFIENENSFDKEFRSVFLENRCLDVLLPPVFY